MSKPKDKQPKISAEPILEKHPKYKDPDIGGLPLAWRFSAADRDGPFSWAALPSERFQEIVEKLHEYETKNWSDILKAGCHPIKIHRLDKPARDRLSDIKRDDVDEVMSFRITGPNRVWVIKDNNIMRVLWWDPDHQVYPTEVDRADREKRKRKEGR